MRFIRVHGRVVPIRDDKSTAVKSAKKIPFQGNPIIAHPNLFKAGVIGIGAGAYSKATGVKAISEGLRHQIEAISLRAASNNLAAIGNQEKAAQVAFKGFVHGAVARAKSVQGKTAGNLGTALVGIGAASTLASMVTVYSAKGFQKKFGAKNK